MNKFFAKVVALFRSSSISGGNRNLIPVNASGFWKPRSDPTPSLNRASALFDQIGGKIILEIGTGIHGALAGNSILVWPVKTSAQRIIAVDLEQQRIDEVRERTSQFPNVELVVADGIRFLKDFDSKIDLLYLDFWVPDPEGAVPGIGRAEAYRDAYRAAKEKMNAHSIILIDDTDHIPPWKHTYIIPDARRDGYSVVYTGRQTLLQR